MRVEGSSIFRAIIAVKSQDFSVSAALTLNYSKSVPHTSPNFIEVQYIAGSPFKSLFNTDLLLLCQMCNIVAVG